MVESFRKKYGCIINNGTKKSTKSCILGWEIEPASSNSDCPTWDLRAGGDAGYALNEL
jgi:hypothetical protein